MSPGRLLLAVFLVAPVASCGGTAAALGADLWISQGQYGEDVFTAALMFFGFLSFLAILAGLLVVGVPMALLLNRAGVSAIARDALFALALAVPALLLARAAPDLKWLAFSYWAATSFLWIAALRWAARKPAR